MRIVLLTDVYAPVVNGVVHHVALLRRELEALGQTVTVVAGGAAQAGDGPHVLRYAGMPLGDTGYQLGWPHSGQIRAVLEEADVLHAHHPLVSGQIAHSAARRSGAAVVFTNHTRYDLYADVYLPHGLAALGRWGVQSYMRGFVPQCNALIAPSRGTALALRTWGISQPIEIIPNGVEVERFSAGQAAPRAALGIPEEAVVALYVGRLSAEKDVVRLLHWFRDAAEAGSPAHLALVGGGPQEEDLGHLVAHLSAEVRSRVHLLGQREYAQIPALLAAANFFVTASGSESHPLTLIEAAAAGLPALGLRSPGISDVVVHGESGLLADNGNDFVAKFVALSLNRTLRMQLGAQARQHSLTLSAAANARRTLALYQRLLG